MNLRGVGEFGLIRRIRKQFPSRQDSILQGIGDDCAVVLPPQGKALLLTTDLLVEGIHFDLACCTFRDIGYKAVASSVSDIVAMGGTPLYFLTSLALPPDTAMSHVDQLYRGIRQGATRYNVRLIGGDTSASHRGIFISIAVVGEAALSSVVTRAGARAGDAIFVTGTLGDSAAGLEILKGLKTRGRRGASPPVIASPLPYPSPSSASGGGGGKGGGKAISYLVRRHLHPTLRMEVARRLARDTRVSSMIDLSDGLASDLRRICEESEVGAEIVAAKIPVSPALRRYAAQAKKEPLTYALSGGEDYELLFTARPGGRIRQAAEIGRVLPHKKGIVLLNKDGSRRPLSARGYEHFTR